MMTIDKTKLKSEVESILAKGAGLLMAIRAEDVRGLLEEIERLVAFEEAYATACNVRNRLIKDNEELRKDGELVALGRAKLAGAMSRLRAKHNDWTAPEALPVADLVWCACGDGFPPNSYGAGFMDANKGVCCSCDAAKESSQ